MSDTEDFLDDFVIVDERKLPQTETPQKDIETICETIVADIAKDIVKDVIFEHKPKEEVLKDIIHDVVEDVISVHPNNNPNVITKSTFLTTSNTIKPLARASWVLVAQLPRAARLVWRAFEIYHDIHSDIRKLFIFYFGLRIATGYFVSPISAFI